MAQTVISHENITVIDDKDYKIQNREIISLCIHNFYADLRI